MKILIADDERDIRDYLRRLLELSGFDVIEADCGESALFALAKTPDISLIILDWMMPGISGLDVLTQLKDQFDTVPILMLSARSEQHDIIKALSYGATDYILKPLDKDHLLFKINGLLNLGRESARKHAARRKNVNLCSTADILITAFSSKQVFLESSYPIPKGYPLIISSEPLARMLDIKPDMRYALKVSNCAKHENKYLICAEFMNLTPQLALKIEIAAQKLTANEELE